MGRIFNPDSKFMIYGEKVADIIWLNVLFLCCSVPVVTAGAAYTAMHSVLLKIYRGEGYKVTKDFFHALRKNLKQSTILWFLYLVVGMLIYCDYNILNSSGEIPVFFKYSLYLIIAVYLISICWIFILQSRYENTVRNTIKNSVLVCKRQVLFHKFRQLIFHKKRQLFFHTHLVFDTHGLLRGLFF